MGKEQQEKPKSSRRKEKIRIRAQTQAGWMQGSERNRTQIGWFTALSWGFTEEEWNKFLAPGLERWVQPHKSNPSVLKAFMKESSATYWSPGTLTSNPASPCPAQAFPLGQVQRAVSTTGPFPRRPAHTTAPTKFPEQRELRGFSSRGRRVSSNLSTLGLSLVCDCFFSYSLVLSIPSLHSWYIFISTLYIIAFLDLFHFIVFFFNFFSAFSIFIFMDAFHTHVYRFQIWLIWLYLCSISVILQSRFFAQADRNTSRIYFRCCCFCCGPGGIWYFCCFPVFFFFLFLSPLVFRTAGPNGEIHPRRKHKNSSSQPGIESIWVSVRRLK